MTLLTLLVTLIIWGLIFYVIWWALGVIALPEPFNKIATVVVVLAVLYVLIGILTGVIAPFPFLTSFRLN